MPYLVVGVQTCCLDHYTLCGVSNVHNKFQDCTVYTQDATMFLTIITYVVVYVQTCCLNQYTLYSVGNVHAKFMGCTDDVQDATGFSNNRMANPESCAYAK